MVGGCQNGPWWRRARKGRARRPPVTTGPSPRSRWRAAPPGGAGRLCAVGTAVTGQPSSPGAAMRPRRIGLNQSGGSVRCRPRHHRGRGLDQLQEFYRHLTVCGAVPACPTGIGPGAGQGARRPSARPALTGMWPGPGAARRGRGRGGRPVLSLRELPPAAADVARRAQWPASSRAANVRKASVCSARRPRATAKQSSSGAASETGRAPSLEGVYQDFTRPGLRGAHPARRPARRHGLRAGPRCARRRRTGDGRAGDVRPDRRDRCGPPRSDRPGRTTPSRGRLRPPPRPPSGSGARRCSGRLSWPDPPAARMSLLVPARCGPRGALAHARWKISVSGATAASGAAPSSASKKSAISACQRALTSVRSIAARARSKSSVSR